MKKIFFSLIILTAGCQKEDVETEIATAVNLTATCGFDDRKTESLIKVTEAKVLVYPSSFMIIETKGDPSARFIACNLPEGLVNGQEIIFTAEQKEIFPFEKWAGMPIKLTSLTLK